MYIAAEVLALRLRMRVETTGLATTGRPKREPMFDVGKRMTRMPRIPEIQYSPKYGIEFIQFKFHTDGPNLFQ